jgi:myotubularin-related protein 10/11/12
VQKIKKIFWKKSILHINFVNRESKSFFTLQERCLDPKYEIQHLEIWQQCYYRWIPCLEIKGGGFPQIDLFNRLLLNNIHKLQKALESGTFNDLPQPQDSTLFKNLTTTSTSTSSSNDGAITNSTPALPTINSFFPFSNNTSNAEFTDMLVTSNELIIEGSIMFDQSSMAYND